MGHFEQWFHPGEGLGLQNVAYQRIEYEFEYGTWHGFWKNGIFYDLNSAPGIEDTVHGSHLVSEAFHDFHGIPLFTKRYVTTPTIPGTAEYLAYGVGFVGEDIGGTILHSALSGYRTRQSDVGLVDIPGGLEMVLFLPPIPGEIVFCGHRTLPGTTIVFQLRISSIQVNRSYLMKQRSSIWISIHSMKRQLIKESTYFQAWASSGVIQVVGYQFTTLG